jgi:enolase
MGMEKPKIANVRSREVLDSKGRPMVEVEIRASDGSVGRGACPCGTSVGSHEAVFLRDGDERFAGMGVRKAVQNVREIIAPALMGTRVTDQKKIDGIMLELDGTSNKSRLGANATYSVSVAAARAASASLSSSLFAYLGGGTDFLPVLPIPVFNMINGGTYGERKVDFQEFLLVPTGAPAYSEALRMAVEVSYRLEEVIRRRYGPQGVEVGHSAGYAAPGNEPAEIIETLLAAAEKAGYGGMFKVGLDCAATHFYRKREKSYSFRGQEIGRDGMIRLLEGLAKAYPIFMIEDPLDEDDFEGFAELSRRLDILVAGDDLFATNLERLKKGSLLRSANGVIFKPNMVGTLSEALDVASYAIDHGYFLIPSIRSGGDAEDPISDIAVAIGASFLKCGAPRSSERTSCQNRLLRIEEELGESAKFQSFPKLEKKFKKGPSTNPQNSLPS